MMESYRTIRGMELKIFGTTLQECPSVNSLALRVSADMLDKGLLRNLPFSAQDRAIVASYDGDILGFIIFSESDNLQIELTWVDPGIRRDRVFETMFEKLLPRFWVCTNVKVLRVRSGNHSPEFLSAAEHVGFYIVDQHLEYMPFLMAA
jgi:hypothetical protein